MTNSIRRFTATLHTADLLVIGFLAALLAVNLVFAHRIAQWLVLVLANLGGILLVIAISALRARFETPLLQAVHRWYLAPMVFLTFKQLYYIIPPLHHYRDYDSLLIEADRWLLGVDPTVWMLQWANPWLTEILQLAYTAFYVLFLYVGWELHRQGREDRFLPFMFIITYGFYLSYAGYFLLPSVGPRFTLHDWPSLDQELPGVWLTPALRWFVNAGGSVPMGVPTEVAIAGTQRDVFPSGHTMMTLVLMILCHRWRLSSRWWVTVNGTLLIIATVYQRYHYVVDLIGGAVFAAFCLATAPRLYLLLTRLAGTRDRTAIREQAENSHDSCGADRR